MVTFFLCSEEEDCVLEKIALDNIGYSLGIHAPEYLHPSLDKNITSSPNSLQSVFEVTLDLLGDGDQLYASAVVRDRLVFIGVNSFDTLAAAALIKRKFGVVQGAAKTGYTHRLDTIANYLYYPDRYLPIDPICKLVDIVADENPNFSFNLEGKIDLICDWLINGNLPG